MPMEELQQLREDAVAHTMRYHKKQSHRTVVVPLTGSISEKLDLCRKATAHLL